MLGIISALTTRDTKALNFSSLTPVLSLNLPEYMPYPHFPYDNIYIVKPFCAQESHSETIEDQWADRSFQPMKAHAERLSLAHLSVESEETAKSVRGSGTTSLPPWLPCSTQNITLCIFSFLSLWGV